MLNPPPITAEKNDVKMYLQIPATKLPKSELGIAINKYFIDVFNKLNLSDGTAFFIVRMFKIDVSPMHIKNEIGTALILRIGVKANKPTNKITEPKQ